MTMPALVSVGFGLGYEMKYSTEELEIRELFYSGAKIIGTMGLYGLKNAIHRIPYTIPKAVGIFLTCSGKYSFVI